MPVLQIAVATLLLDRQECLSYLLDIGSRAFYSSCSQLNHAYRLLLLLLSLHLLRLVSGTRSGRLWQA